MSQPPSPHILDPARYRPSYYITRDRNLESFVEAAFNTAMDYFARKEWDKAAAAFARCIEYRDDFVEAYIWLARLSPDPAQQRDHLTSALAYEPTHGEALRDLMILNGELTYDDKLDEYGRPQFRRVEGVAVSRTENLRCPRCASTQLVDDDSAGAGALGGELYCESCGYRMPRPGASTGYESLAMANLKRRAQAVRWQVGTRVLHCDSCGAERTIPATKLADGCPFCGSRNVIEQDALGSFQQPDGIIPFSVSEQSALELVEAQLKGWGERIKGWMSDNRVRRVAISGVFLPFWAFDVLFEVTRTTYDLRNPDVTFNPVIAHQTETFADMKPNLLVAAVTQPPRALTRRLGPYKVSKAVAYQPRMLAQHAAELYSVDVDAAAMRVHEIVSEGAKQKYSRPTASPQVTTHVSTMVRNVTFQLLLLPVWSATIFERDGDVRPALVNGQTGRVALGRAAKPG